MRVAERLTGPEHQAGQVMVTDRNRLQRPQFLPGNRRRWTRAHRCGRASSDGGTEIWRLVLFHPGHFEMLESFHQAEKIICRENRARPACAAGVRANVLGANTDACALISCFLSFRDTTSPMNSPGALSPL